MTDYIIVPGKAKLKPIGKSDIDVVCPDCGKCFGHSQGAHGMLGMHRRNKHG